MCMEQVNDEFTVSYKTYYDYVLKLINNRVSDINDSKDICQDVFIQFYKKMDSIHDQKNWLRGASRIGVLEFYRKKNDYIYTEDIHFDGELTISNSIDYDLRILTEEVVYKSGIFKNEKDLSLFEFVTIFNYSYRDAGKRLGFSKRKVEYRYKAYVKKILMYFRKKGIKRIKDII